MANLSLKLHWLEAVDHVGDHRYFEVVEKHERSQELVMRVEHKLCPNRVRKIP